MSSLAMVRPVWFAPISAGPSRTVQMRILRIVRPAPLLATPIRHFSSTLQRRAEVGSGPALSQTNRSSLLQSITSSTYSRF